MLRGRSEHAQRHRDTEARTHTHTHTHARTHTHTHRHAHTHTHSLFLSLANSRCECVCSRPGLTRASPFQIMDILPLTAALIGQTQPRQRWEVSAKCPCEFVSLCVCMSLCACVRSRCDKSSVVAGNNARKFVAHASLQCVDSGLLPPASFGSAAVACSHP